MKDAPFIREETPNLHSLAWGGGMNEEFTDEIGLAWVRVLESIHEAMTREAEETEADSAS